MPIYAMQAIVSCQSTRTHVQISPLMSKYAHSNENGRFDEMKMTVHGFDNFGEF